MHSRIPAAFLFWGQASGSYVSNNYFDTLIYTFFQYVLRRNQLDPIPLPDFNFDFKGSRFFGEVNGRIEFTEGTLSGLNTVLRNNESEGSSAGVLRCTLSFSNLETSYKGRMKYGILPKVTIKAKGAFRNPMIVVGTVEAPGGKAPTIGTFYIQNIESMSTNLTGLGLFDRNRKNFEAAYEVGVIKLVSDVINSHFKKVLEEAVSNVPLPTFNPRTEVARGMIMEVPKKGK